VKKQSLSFLVESIPQHFLVSESIAIFPFQSLFRALFSSAFCDISPFSHLFEFSLFRFLSKIPIAFLYPPEMSIEDKMPLRDFVFSKFREMDKSYYIRFSAPSRRSAQSANPPDEAISQRGKDTMTGTRRRAPSVQLQLARRRPWVDTLTSLDGRGRPRTDFPPWPPSMAYLPKTSNSSVISVW
jgi:hypothetical protein